MAGPGDSDEARTRNVVRQLPGDVRWGELILPTHHDECRDRDSCERRSRVRAGGHRQLRAHQPRHRVGPDHRLDHLDHRRALGPGRNAERGAHEGIGVGGQTLAPERSHGIEPLEAACVGIGRAPGIGQHERAEAHRLSLPGTQKHVAPHRQSAPDHRFGGGRFQHREEVVGQEIHRVLPITHVAGAVTPEVRHDQAPAPGERLPLAHPHPAVQGEAVQQHDRGSALRPVQPHVELRSLPRDPQRASSRRASRRRAWACHMGSGG